MIFTCLGNLSRFASDTYVLGALQVFLLLLLVYAKLPPFSSRAGKSSGNLSVRRGPQSWARLHLSSGILSVLAVEIINTADAFKGYKTIITVTDLAALFYLCFFNVWFRNVLLSVAIASEDLLEE